MTFRHLGRLAAAAAVALVATGLAGGAQAHHSFAAEFDSRKAVAVQGVVTKAQFVNPHSWLYLDVKTSDGTVTNWGFEFGTPSSLRNRGIAKEDLRYGSEVRVEGFRAKNGGPFGYSQFVTLPDGRKVQIGSAPDAPAAASTAGTH